MALALAARSPNHLLAALAADDFESLRPNLRRFELKRGDELAAAGAALTRVYFPHGGVIALVVSLAGGEAIEAAMIGRDSVFGAMDALGDGIAVNDGVVQLSGAASMIESAQLRAVADRSGPLRAILIRHAQGLLAQAEQSAACNAFHSAEARLARLLLRLRDLTGDEKFPLTQESLAEMIGVRRNSVSLIAHNFQQARLIKYSRGQIEIIDAAGLTESACECYLAVRRGYDRLLHRPLSGRARQAVSSDS